MAGRALSVIKVHQTGSKDVSVGVHLGPYEMLTLK
jgi:hypothetical protein